jgi:DNA-binding CsgD family transcriptional regulator
MQQMNVLDLELKEELTKILTPYQEKIKALNIDYIGYREFYPDGTSMGFCSNDRWYEAHKETILNEDMAIHYAKEITDLNEQGFDYIIRTSNTVNNRFLDFLLSHDICNSLLIYKKSRNIINQYSFIASTKNLSALNFFFNKRQEFVDIINLYEAEFARVCAQPKYLALRRLLFLEKTATKLFSNFSITPSSYNLTNREQECANLLAYGASDKDIANKLNISIRTVEGYIANIKKKLRANNRFEASNILKEQMKL